MRIFIQPAPIGRFRDGSLGRRIDPLSHKRLRSETVKFRLEPVIALAQLAQLGITEPFQLNQRVCVGNPMLKLTGKK